MSPHIINQCIMRKEIYAVLSKIGTDTYDRKDLEDIEGETYKSVDEVLADLKRINPSATKMPTIYPLYEFTTDWNDTDGSRRILSIRGTWLSYVFIEK